MEHELLAAIAADPHDDVPRLVYADWLMERGDPKGELIALQCSLARTSAADEPCNAAALDRERALVEAHSGAWIAPLVELAAGTYELRRGLVEHATLDLDVALEPLLAAAPLVRSVALRSQTLQRAPTAAWSQLVALELLDLCYPDSASDVAALAASPHVTQLRRLQVTNAQLGLDLLDPLLQIDANIEHFGLSAVTWVAAISASSMRSRDFRSSSSRYAVPSGPPSTSSSSSRRSYRRSQRSRSITRTSSCSIRRSCCRRYPRCAGYACAARRSMIATRSRSPRARSRPGYAGSSSRAPP